MLCHLSPLVHGAWLYSNEPHRQSGEDEPPVAAASSELGTRGLQTSSSEREDLSGGHQHSFAWRTCEHGQSPFVASSRGITGRSTSACIGRPASCRLQSIRLGKRLLNRFSSAFLFPCYIPDVVLPSPPLSPNYLPISCSLILAPPCPILPTRLPVASGKSGTGHWRRLVASRVQRRRRR